MAPGVLLCTLCSAHRLLERRTIHATSTAKVLLLLPRGARALRPSPWAECIRLLGGPVSLAIIRRPAPGTSQQESPVKPSMGSAGPFFRNRLVCSACPVATPRRRALLCSHPLRRRRCCSSSSLFHGGQRRQLGHETRLTLAQGLELCLQLRPQSGVLVCARVRARVGVMEGERAGEVARKNPGGIRPQGMNEHKRLGNPCPRLESGRSRPARLSHKTEPSGHVPPNPKTPASRVAVRTHRALRRRPAVRAPTPAPSRDAPVPSTAPAAPPPPPPVETRGRACASAWRCGRARRQAAEDGGLQSLLPLQAFSSPIQHPPHTHINMNAHLQAAVEPGRLERRVGRDERGGAGAPPLLARRAVWISGERGWSWRGALEALERCA